MKSPATLGGVQTIMAPKAIESKNNLKALPSSYNLMGGLLVHTSAFLILVSNALHHSGSIVVTLPATQQGSTMSFTVTDSGRGFDPTEVEPSENGLHRIGLGETRRAVSAEGWELVLESRPYEKTIGTIKGISAAP